MNNIMYYFGTSLRQHGHFLWELTDYNMRNMGIKYDHLPFHPEYLTNNMLNGEVCFYQCTTHTVIGITGSCKDDRPGCKSIFWVLEKISFNEMKKRILNHRVAQQIITQMPFEIIWEY